MHVWNEFKQFAIKGNVIDLAVGVIIGSAFGKIVSSLVGDILMPPLGAVIKKVDLKNLKLALARSPGGEPVSTLNYGSFLQNIIEFFFIAVAIFILIKGINRFRRQEPQTVSSPPKQEVLLQEIRDLLKENLNKKI